MAIQLNSSASQSIGMDWGRRGVNRTWFTNMPFSFAFWWKRPTFNNTDTTCIWGRPDGYNIPTFYSFGNKRLYFTFGGGAEIYWPDDTLTANVWHHLAVVCEGDGTNQIHVYHNGSRTNTTRSSYDSSDWTQYVLASGTYWNPQPQDKFCYDDFCLWSAALSDSDISGAINNLNGHHNYKTANIVGQWRFVDKTTAEQGSTVPSVLRWGGGVADYEYIEGPVSWVPPGPPPIVLPEGHPRYGLGKSTRTIFLISHLPQGNRNYIPPTFNGVAEGYTSVNVLSPAASGTITISENEYLNSVAEPDLCIRPNTLYDPLVFPSHPAMNITFFAWVASDSTGLLIGDDAFNFTATSDTLTVNYGTLSASCDYSPSETAKLLAVTLSVSSSTVTLKLYLNGVLMATESGAVAPVVPEDPFKVFVKVSDFGWVYSTMSEAELLAIYEGAGSIYETEQSGVLPTTGIFPC